MSNSVSPSPGVPPQPAAGAAPPAPTLYQRLDKTASRPYPTSEYLRRAIWEVVCATVFRWSPRRANRWRTWLLGRFGAQLHPTAVVRRSARVQHPWLLTMGAHSAIADEVLVYNLGPIRIGEHTVVSQRVHLCAGTHDYHRDDLPLLRSFITIGRGVWVCADAFIGPDVTVGDNALVGARSVVMRDVPPAMIVAGNPARVIKPRPHPQQTDHRGSPA
ncbi:MAG: putative colanic acid biosynthesis acetyltransferase [Phycisphaerae bacterium]|nr:putative colanic acid biosynthesis acetyltransferase [Phycisphaerae bacterium]